MKYIWLAVQIEEDGKYYAHTLLALPSDNLVCKLAIKGLVTANICQTKKAAAELVNYWNECHKANGRYMFDCPAF